MPTATASPPATFRNARRPNGPSNRPPGGSFTARGKREKSSADDHEILFQKFFKSVGPRTYAAQVKRAKNGNHYLVLMEGKRDEKTAEVRKTRVFVYSEDFVEFFRLVKSAAEFIKANPLPAEVQAKRDKFWAKALGDAGTPGKSAPGSTSQTSRSPRSG